MDGTIPPKRTRGGSPREVCAALQRNLRDHGLSQLTVEPMPSADADTVLARVIDSSGTVVLALSINRSSGLIRDVA